MRSIKIIFLCLLIFCVTLLSAQEILVSGNISDADGEPLIGATIIEKGTANGTVADLNGVVADYNGNYEITVTTKEAILEVAYIGYETQTIQVEDNTTINFTLAEMEMGLPTIGIPGFRSAVGRARGRTASVQKIPESVTALNLEGIEAAGITDVISFSNLVPNLKFNTSQAIGLNFITVRGIPQIRFGDAPVAFVIDGVTVPDPSLLSQELYDLALVEVVKGPQGALYGKNAIGGAINIYTQEPTNQLKNRVKLGYGNGNSLLGQFVSSGAIVKDKLYYRLATQYKSTDGLLTNEFLNEKVDFREDFNIRAQLMADVSKNFSIKASYQYFNVDGGATYYSVNPFGSTYYTGYPGGVLNPNPKDGNDNIIVSDLLGMSDMKNHNGNIKLDYVTGNIKLQSITSYNTVDRTSAGDLDFLDFPILTQGEITSTKTFNQEFRVQNRNSKDKLKWTAGGFFQNVEEPIFQDGLDYFSYDEPFTFITADLINNNRTIALFGFADYEVTEQLTLSAGLRFDIDWFEQDDFLNDPPFNSTTNNELQPKASISYQATEDILLYANYGIGYRTGGFNPSSTNLFNKDFDSETSDNYELGIKTTFWDDRIILNGAGFYTSLNNQQQYILDLETFVAGVYNYDKSSVLGFELDARVRTSKFLDIFANYGYTNAEIIEGGKTGGENGDATDNSQYDGNKTPFVPVDNFSVGLESNIPINKDMKFTGFLNLNQTGTTYWHESNLTENTTDAYSLLDARLGFDYKMFGIELWGRNLTDTQYYQEFSPGQFVGSPDDVGWRGQPRSLGVALEVRF